MFMPQAADDPGRLDKSVGQRILSLSSEPVIDSNFALWHLDLTRRFRPGSSRPCRPIVGAGLVPALPDPRRR